MLNKEGMLKNKIKCDLTVISMRGWKRGMSYSQTGLPWVPTSPHIPYKETAEYYVATGIMGELGYFSEGVGYTIPFETFAADWIDGEVFAQRMNELKLKGVIFRPITFKPYYGKSKDKTLHGVQLYIINPSKVNLMSLQFLLMQVNNELYPDRNPFGIGDSSGFRMFDLVCGTSKIRELFTKQMKYEDIESYLMKDVYEFKKISSKYHLYYTHSKKK